MGYFVIDGLVVGLAPSYTKFRSEVSSAGVTVSSSVNTWGLAALARYYYLLTGSLFVDGGASLGYFGGNPTIGMDSEHDSGFGFNLHAGISLAFGKSFGGVASLLAFYDHAFMTYEEGGVSNSEVHSDVRGALKQFGHVTAIIDVLAFRVSFVLSAGFPVVLAMDDEVQVDPDRNVRRHVDGHSGLQLPLEEAR